MRAAVRAVGAAAVVIVLAGCGASSAPAPVVLGDPRPGLHLTGTVGGRQIAVADARPDLVVGDCPRGAGTGSAAAAGEAVCFVSRDLTGERVVVVLSDPGMLEEGVQRAVGDEAIVDLVLGTAAPRRATGGVVTPSHVEPGARYRGAILLRFADGQVSGQFDVTPRPD